MRAAADVSRRHANTGDIIWRELTFTATGTFVSPDILGVLAGPYVRSSYKAFETAKKNDDAIFQA